jgi:hypothetical protein
MNAEAIVIPAISFLIGVGIVAIQNYLYPELTPKIQKFLFGWLYK